MLKNVEYDGGHVDKDDWRWSMHVQWSRGEGWEKEGKIRIKEIHGDVLDYEDDGGHVNKMIGGDQCIMMKRRSKGEEEDWGKLGALGRISG